MNRTLEILLSIILMIAVPACSEESISETYTEGPRETPTGKASQGRANPRSTLRRQPTSPSNDWRQFRGPDFGRTQMKGLPIKWNAKENIAWKTELPGHGSSSPIVVGKRIVLTCYTGYGLHKKQPGDWKNLKRHVLCLDRDTGHVLWNKAIRATRKPQPYASWMQVNGYASHTPTSDGERIFAHLGNSGVYAFDFEGKQLWHVDVGASVSNYGSAGSPIIHENMLLVNASVECEHLIALDRVTGKELWRSKLHQSYTTPVVVKVGDRYEVIIASARGRGLVGFDAKTGRELWHWNGYASRRYICASPILEQGIIYGMASVDGPLMALRPGGSGKITATHQIWKAKKFAAEASSPVYYNGKVYWLGNYRYAVYDAKTGAILHKELGPWAKYHAGLYSTPLIAEERIYIQTRGRGTWVLKLDNQLTVLANNRVEQSKGFSVNASPVPHQGQLLLRTNQALYCVGTKKGGTGNTDR